MTLSYEYVPVLSDIPDNMCTTKLVTLWIIALNIVHHCQAKPMPEPVMMDIAKAMIPQASDNCFQNFPIRFSMGGIIGEALWKIFAPTSQKNQIKMCI